MKQYYILVKTQASSPYSITRAYIQADSPFTARKLFEAMYGADRLLGPACPC
jgi:hypothetical protein